MSAVIRRLPERGLSAWVLLALIVNAVAVVMTRLIPHPTVAYAAAFDVAVTVPVAYYLLVVRSGAKSALTMVPLVVLALLRALYIAPGAAVLRPVFGALAELAVIAFLVHRVHRVRRGLRGAEAQSDLVDRVRAITTEMVRVAPIAEVLTSEIAVLAYAFGWGMKAHVPPGARPFTVHRESGIVGLLGCLAGMSIVEVLVVHVLVAHTSVRLAWIVTGLGAYGIVWVVAVARSFALRPILVTSDAVEIRSGLLATLRAPLSSIARVEIAMTGAAGDWSVVPASAPNVRVTLASPLLARGMYGRKRAVSGVALAVDDPGGFVEAVRSASGCAETET